MFETFFYKEFIFYSPITSIFRIFNKKKRNLRKFKMADPIWWIQDDSFFDVKDVIVTSLLLLMTANLLSYCLKAF